MTPSRQDLFFEVIKWHARFEHQHNERINLEYDTTGVMRSHRTYACMCYPLSQTNKLRRVCDFVARQMGIFDDVKND